MLVGKGKLIVILPVFLMLIIIIWQNGQIVKAKSENFIWPMNENELHVIQGFGKTFFSDRYERRVHWGIDISVAPLTDIRSAGSGVVLGVSDSCPNHEFPECNDKNGNWIIIFHPTKKIFTYYGHLAEKSKFLIGDWIEQGTIIGHEGGSGYHFDIKNGEQTNSGTHLHFAIGNMRVYKNNWDNKMNFNGQFEDPLKFLPTLPIN